MEDSEINPVPANARRFESMNTWKVQEQHYTTQTRTLRLTWDLTSQDWEHLSVRCLRAKNNLQKYTTDEHMNSANDQEECMLCEFVRTLELNLEQLGQDGGQLEDIEYPEVLLEHFQFSEEIGSAMAILLDFLDPVDAIDPRKFPGVSSYDSPTHFLKLYTRTNEVLLCLKDRAIQRWIRVHTPLILSQMELTHAWWSHSCLKPTATESEGTLSRVRLRLGRVFPFVSRAPIIIPPVNDPQRGVRLLVQWEMESSGTLTLSERKARHEENQYGHRWVFIFSWEPALPSAGTHFLYQHGKFWNVFVVTKTHAHAVNAGLLDGGEYNSVYTTARIVIHADEEQEMPSRLHAEMPLMPLSPPTFSYGLSTTSTATSATEIAASPVHPLAEVRQRTHSAMDVIARPTAANVAQRAMSSDGKRRGRARANSMSDFPIKERGAEKPEKAPRQRRLSGFGSLRFGKRKDVRQDDLLA